MKKVLIIDDEDLIREGLKIALEMEGFQVQICPDGKDAMKILQDFKPEIVITDIIMPETDGIEVILSLKQTQNPPKIIAISGGGRISAIDHLKSARQLGASATLTKPFSSTDLISVIRKL
jgi:YesN/AraC family two-component response regulator